jgi:hypothetical protein
VTNDLGIIRTIITELEEELKTVKKKLSLEFKESIRGVATLNT